MLPSFLKEYFWDGPFENIDMGRHKRYIIARLLELGDERAIEWLEEVYTAADLSEVAETSRSLSPRSRNYWMIKYIKPHHA